jgi:glutathione S-transferase
VSDLILHHYPMSPYAEKMRALLGYSGLPWQSCVTREMPPRPVLEALAGGYRKIPVAQDGADVFCDTRIISAEIAARTGRPTLCLAGAPPVAADFARDTDTRMFFACVMHANSLAMMRKVWNSMTLADIGRFAKDRYLMGKEAKVPMIKPQEAGPMLRGHAARIESMLTQDFLFGTEPTIADFAAYHGLWFIRDLAERDLLAGYARLNAWMDRIKAFGHGAHTDISGYQALALANAATPRAIDPADRGHPLVGKLVIIAPDDYAAVGTSGILEACASDRYILSRESEATGRVHVHFPREGFEIQSAKG